ncbi:MAG: MFS transporter [Solirubrobacteraceae bacterium]
MALDGHASPERDPRRWWALGALTLAVLAVSLDGTVLSVALPTLAGALHASESQLQWFSSGYLLVLGASMLPAGAFGDRYGRKRTLLAALGLFGAGSAACAAAPSAGAFIAARVVLGIAGAGVIVMALSSLTVLFDEDERPKAVGVWAAANFVALPIGPILGGWLLSHAWWGWVFLLNVPVAGVGMLVGWRLLPESRSPLRAGFDPLGMLTSVAGIAILTYGLIHAGQHGWSDPVALTAIAAGLTVIAGFFGWESHRRTLPDRASLVDLDLFESPSYTWGVILAAVAVVAMIGVLFTMPQYFQGVAGTGAMGAGLRLLPLIGGLVLAALPADRIARAVGSKAAVALGFAILAGGLALGAATTVHSGGGFVAAWMALVGIGMGLAMATTTSVALATLSQERSSVGSAVLQALNKTAAPLGTAMLGSVLSAGYLARVDTAGLPPALAAVVRQSIFGAASVARRAHSASLLGSAHAAFVHGMDAALLASAGVALAGAILATMFLPAIRPPAAPSGHRRAPEHANPANLEIAIGAPQ